MENLKGDRGYESDGAESDSSVKTVKSNKGGGGGSPASSCAPSVCATPAVDRSHPNVKVELANGDGRSS